MPFTTVSYRVFWSVVEYLVEITPEDGSAPFFLNKEGIQQALANVRKERANYRSAAAWMNALGMFEGALEALKHKVESEAVEAMR